MAQYPWQASNKQSLLQRMMQLRQLNWYDLPTLVLNEVLTRPAADIKTCSYGAHERQQLDVYQPYQPRTDRALLLFVHGGSWQQGDKAQYVFLAQHFAAAGFHVAVMNYRLAPRYSYQDFVADVISAINWLHLPAQCHRFNYDATQTVVMGHSAGAFNVMAAVYHDKALFKNELNNVDYIKAIIGIAGPYSFEHRGDPIAKDALPQQLAPSEIMPDYFVFSNPIRHLLLVAERDNLVDNQNTENMATALRRVNNAVEVNTIRHTNHITIIATLSRGLARFFSTDKTVKEFLNQALMT